jgi:hypothetical protein
MIRIAGDCNAAKGRTQVQFNVSAHAECNAVVAGDAVLNRAGGE